MMTREVGHGEVTEVWKRIYTKEEGWLRLFGQISLRNEWIWPEQVRMIVYCFVSCVNGPRVLADTVAPYIIFPSAATESN